MDQNALQSALARALPKQLADDLVAQFMEIRKDVATGTLGRGSPGKFVETVVQSLQAIENAGSYDSRPKMDEYLKNLEARPSKLPDGLRICAARLGRAMYSLRSKRNIVHKAEIDPAAYDLRLLYAGAQWTVAELLALANGIDGEEAARLVGEVQLPVGELVEAIDGRKIVHADLTVREEVLVVLTSSHPLPISTSELMKSLDRRSASSVRNAVSALWKEKLIHRGVDRSVVLTEPGLRSGIRIAQEHVA